MKKKFYLLLLAAVLAVCLIPTAVMADGTTLYVDDDYTSDSCDDHIWNENAFNTIQGAVDKVNSTNGIITTIHVKAGTYNETVSLNKINLKYTIGDVDWYGNVNFVTEEGAVVNGIFTFGNDSVKNIANLTVSGFTFSDEPNPIYLMNSGGTSKNIVVTNNTITANVTSSGNIYINSGVVEDVVVSGNTVTNNVGTYCLGLGGTNSIIKNVTVSDNVFNGKYVGIFGQFVNEGIQITNNTFNITGYLWINNGKAANNGKMTLSANKFNTQNPILAFSKDYTEKSDIVIGEGNTCNGNVFDGWAEVAADNEIQGIDPNHDSACYYNGKLYLGDEPAPPADVVIEPVEVNEETGEIKVGGEEITVEGTGGDDQPTAQEAATSITETLDNPSVTGFEETNMEKATEVTKETTIQVKGENNKYFNLSMILDAVKEQAAEQFKKANGKATVTKDDEITVKPTNEGEGEQFIDTDVTKQLNIELTAAAVEKDGNNTTVTKMTFEVKPLATINGTDADGKPYSVTAVIPNEAITSEITFLLPVHSSVEAEYAAVYHEGVFMGNYKIEGDVTNGKFIRVSSSEFSEFSYVVLNTENTVAGINMTPYPTLEYAIDNVKNMETVTLCQNSDETIVISRAVAFKLLLKDGVKFGGEIGAGKGYKLEQLGDMYIVTKVPTILERLVAGLAVYTGWKVIKTNLSSNTVKPFYNFYSQCSKLFPKYQKLFTPFGFKNI